jgi:hypothetical protein
MTRAALRSLAASNAGVDIQAVGRSMAPLWLASLRGAEIQDELEKLGLEPTERYFPPRAAPLGAASAPLVTSTFFNFSPLAVSRAIPHVWDKATPQQVLDAQLTGVDRAFTRAFADVDSQVIEQALELLRSAADAASERPEGRPLFAAYASLPWPDEPHLALWHAHYVLREFRGDGHIAALTAEGLTGIEALALHIAMVPMLGPMFRASRAWTDEQWNECCERLASDGWITIGDNGTIALTESGKERRDAIEAWTDELDWPGYGSIGPDGCARVLELAQPITDALNNAGLGMNMGAMQAQEQTAQRPS